MWNWWVSLDQPFSEMELVTTSKIERLSLLFSIFLLISILPHATIPPPLPETSANSKFTNSVYKRTCIYLNTTIQIARWPNPLNFSLGKKGFPVTGPDRITLIRVFQSPDKRLIWHGGYDMYCWIFRSAWLCWRTLYRIPVTLAPPRSCEMSERVNPDRSLLRLRKRSQVLPWKTMKDFSGSLDWDFQWDRNLGENLWDLRGSNSRSLLNML